jgi:hypothetical protein
LQKTSFIKASGRPKRRPAPIPASFGPEEFARIAKAYEIAVLELQLIDRDAPIAKLVAAKIIDLARRGEHDPASISAKALEELKAG